MFSNSNKVRELNEMVIALEQQVTVLNQGREKLQRALGTSNPEEIIARIEHLEQQVQEMATPPDDEDENILTGLSDPRQVLGKIRSFTSKIQSLNGTVGSMEEQLMSIYEDKETLEREIGASDVDDVLEVFRNLNNTIGSMEAQLMTMYAGREMLDVELGKSDPREIITMFKNVSRMVHSASAELGTVRAPINIAGNDMDHLEEDVL